MCRNIKTLHNFEPPATIDEVRASALAVRPQAERLHASVEANEHAFNHAVDDVTRAARELLASLVSNAPPRDRQVEAVKARARSAKRFGTPAPKLEHAHS
jgi:hypothetical protein